MLAKAFGDTVLKSIGLDGTWIPRGFFGESVIICKGGHNLKHNDSVRITSSHLATKFSSGHREIINLKKIEDIHTGTIVYTVDATDGTVIGKCPIDGEIVFTYTPNPNYKNFKGELNTTIDGMRI